MKKDVLVRKGQHMGPMYAVLKRYGIGKPDKYDRGLWISSTDLVDILSGMESDPVSYSGIHNGKKWIAVNGTNQHNQVLFSDFAKLFSEAAS